MFSAVIDDVQSQLELLLATLLSPSTVYGWSVWGWVCIYVHGSEEKCGDPAGIGAGRAGNRLWIQRRKRSKCCVSTFTKSHYTRSSVKSDGTINCLERACSVFVND
ncbi:hypothetical protein AMECASPLE_003298 [Ameca splendens]|uniref:Uncharacterized protein n=1 Tax=Ameca splendens TaxID=208324 RepID=A0ABV0YXJ6_9TELE